MSKCRACGDGTADVLINFGRQALLNRYVAKPAQDTFRHKLELGACRRCATIQLTAVAPAEQVRPRYAWISYREPEEHLDTITDWLCKHLALTPQSAIWGLSSVDDSLLQRFKQRGFVKTLSCQPFLVRSKKSFGTETIQQHVSDGALEALTKKYGKADLLIARRVLEHSYAPLKFLKNLKRVVQNQGHVVFEVPDSTRPLRNNDYTMVWEERLSYFVPASLKRLLARAGMSVKKLHIVTLVLDDAMLAVVSMKTSSVMAPTKKERTLAKNYGKNFPSLKSKVSAELDLFHQSVGPIALLGAGHLGGFLVNAFDVASKIDVVVDDDATKQKYRMPGSRLPIEGSSALLKRGIKLCVLGAGPGSERKIIDRYHDFIAAGGRFATLFPKLANAPVPFVTEINA